MPASLLRARRPFLFRNVVTGIAIASFGVGVWAYSISAVKQDVFDDVDEQARALNLNDPSPTPSDTLPGSSIAAGNLPHETPVSGSPILETDWAADTHRRSNLLTRVWGAPPVDHIGRLDEKIHVQWKMS